MTMSSRRAKPIRSASSQRGVHDREARFGRNTSKSTRNISVPRGGSIDRRFDKAQRVLDWKPKTSFESSFALW